MLTGKIKSSEQAMQQSKKLKSVWSEESHLTQRILIYQCELLETIARRLARQRKAKQ